jgi:hypothetical protein
VIQSMADIPTPWPDADDVYPVAHQAERAPHESEGADTARSTAHEETAPAV